MSLERAALTLRRIEVRGTPGIRSGFALENLCPGINLIYGPNASGKTTTARTIQALLWPTVVPWPRATLGGEIALHGSAWRVEVDAGLVRHQRDGVDSDPPAIAPAETRDRYILTLHELLRDENRPFAEAILRESAGGYDVGEAVQALGFRARPSSPRKLESAVDAAREAVRKARAGQEGLRQQEARLGELREQRQRCTEAAERARLLAAALRRAEARRELDEACRLVESFPPATANLVGDEGDRIETIRGRLDEARARLSAEEQVIANAAAQREAARLQDAPVPDGLVEALRKQCQRLQDFASAIDRASDEVEKARAERAAARRRIVDSISDDEIAALDGNTLAALVQVSRTLEALELQEQAVGKVAEWLGEVTPPPDLDRLRRGIDALARRLQAPANAAGPGGASAAGQVAAVMAILEATALGVLVHWSLFVLVVAGVIALFAARSRRGSARTSEAAAWERAYFSLGLQQPARWDVEEIEKVLDQLVAHYAKAAVDSEKAQRWAGLEEQRAELARLRASAETDRRRLTQVLGFGPPEDSHTLTLLIENLNRWQDCDRRLRGASAALEHARSEHRELLMHVNHTLEPFGYPAALDHAAAHGFVDALASRLEQLRRAEVDEANARRAVDQLNHDIDGLLRERRAIFDRLGLEPDDEVGLQRCLEKLADYRAAVKTREQATFAVDAATRELEDHPDLLAASHDTLAGQLREAEWQAAQLDEIQKQIVAIETLIDQAKEAHDLERALAEERDALDALREARERDYDLAAGWVLAEFVQERTRDRDRPRVFHRAREIFSRITQGRYRLEFENRPEPAFRATDVTTGLVHSLDELSSATRLQLLMAVRVAFVEETEQGPRLPLILDETLGNSDEQRARAIIDATIEICRDGRQVFYFTAQHDEIGKWLSILGDHSDVPAETFNLSEIRGLAEYEGLPLADLRAPAPSAVPRPDGRSREEYGRALRVPMIDPLLDEPGSIHLWHLVTDLDVLHRLLSAGITTWGPLENLASLGGVDALTGDGHAYHEAAARARVLQAAIEAWRIGRGRPVGRAELLDSGAVSEAFLDSVAELASQVGGDARRILVALEEGAVKRFRQTAIADLRAYFLANGYLDEAEPLTVGDIRIRALSAAAPDIEAGHLAPADIDDILAGLKLDERPALQESS